MSKTVTINGRIYDVHTGMPVDTTQAQAHAQHQHEVSRPSVALHQTTQKSHTLNRRIVQKKAAAASMHKQPTINPLASRHPSIAKFAPHPSGIAPNAAEQPEKHVAHPIVERAHKQQAAAALHKKQQMATPAPKPSQVIKEEAIQESIASAPSHTANHKQVKQPKKRLPRFMSVASASLALLLLGGYFTYLNMPSLSVRVAAAQAGVNASYPSYHPDGYSLNGPVAYTQGQVNMKFASNSGPQNFTVSQSKTSWDSSAVLDNYIKQKAGDNYLTYDEHGLTIYTYGGNAAWVNGGVLYTITGDAPLSSDQIRHIATSM
jgi:hypothetical protein